MPEVLTPERFRWALLLAVAIALVLLYNLSENGRYQNLSNSVLVCDTRKASYDTLPWLKDRLEENRAARRLKAE